MAFHSPNPVREQLKAEILSALSATQESLTTGDLYHACPSATKPDEVAKVAYDMKKKGMIADGGKVPHPRGSPVNSYRYPSQDDPRIEAAKPIQPEIKVKPSRQPAIKRKPAPGHPFAASIRPQEAHDSLPRVTRDLPIHLTTATPQMAAESIRHYLEEEIMSEDPIEYVPDPDAFSLEMSEPEEYTDEELIDELMAKMSPLPVADDDAPKNPCKCHRLPKLPRGYRYAAISADIVSEDDDETMNLLIADEGTGPFAQIDTTGKMRFDSGELAMIGHAADAMIQWLSTVDQDNG